MLKFYMFMWLCLLDNYFKCLYNTIVSKSLPFCNLQFPPFFFGGSILYYS